jgi:hypothetical protein
MEKPNWVCITCGMWSSRKYSVKRHILTVHGGNSLMVSFIEYIVGRQTGIYRPPYPASPTGHRDVQFREPKKIARPFDTFQEEFWKEKAREAARKDSQHGW